MNIRTRFTALAGALLLATSALLIACGGEDRPNVDVIDDGSSGSGTASGASGSGSATGEPVTDGVVEDKPAGATQLDVVLREWEVSPATKTIEAGDIYFFADNQGPNDPHELVIIRSDLDPGDLPTDEDGGVPEDEVDIIGEIEPFAPGSQAATTFTLEPGNYVLICNITEIEDGEIESHYQLGMRIGLTVE